jgi:Cu+-exporting ATPase
MVRSKLLDFDDGRQARVRFFLPTIHCVACVWLLENLYRLHPGVGRSRVNFVRREVDITLAPEVAKLSEVAALLERLGYAPELTLAELGGEGEGGGASAGGKPAQVRGKRLALQIGLAGFAFGNIMLFSLPLYFGMDSLSGPKFRWVFGWLSLVLALPVVLYSAGDYWRSAWASFRQRMLTLDVPIAAGLAALYVWSGWEILSGAGEGYLDSLAGLVFFLLLGRAFQQKTHDRLGFDRDYRGFFPLAVVRCREDGEEETVAISGIGVGDRLRVRHGELIPADARLMSGEALIDYSFVTGESDPVPKAEGEHVYAGGRQVGGAIEVQTVKPVSQSYLTSLWDDEAFRKGRDGVWNSLTNRYSRRFTVVVLGVALASLVGWVWVGEGGTGLKAFTSVLIVACPCALALAAPVALGNAHRILGRLGVYLRNAQVVESLAEVEVVAFDKTGTLTRAEAPGVRFHGEPLKEEEAAVVVAACRPSAHPLARRLALALAPVSGGKAAVAEGSGVQTWEEVAGSGIKVRTREGDWMLGSAAWLRSGGVAVDPEAVGGVGTVWKGGLVHVAAGGRYRGVFELEHRVRPAVDRLLTGLTAKYELALLSGDHAGDRERFAAWFGSPSVLHFDLSPRDKLDWVRGMRKSGRRVMMVGDGLNDAGALREAEVGVAVVEGTGKFSPASDVILAAERVVDLGSVLDYGRRVASAVRTGFIISAAYNVVGVGIAAAGWLSPLVCAVLMPLSSVSVVAFAMAATRRAAGRSGLPVAKTVDREGRGGDAWK